MLDLGGFFVDFGARKHTGSTYVDLTILTRTARCDVSPAIFGRQGRATGGGYTGFSFAAPKVPRAVPRVALMEHPCN